MSTFTKVKLSGSTNGRGVKIAATATAGTTLHTADATALDEVWLYLQNNDAAVPIQVTIECGGTGSPDDLIIVTVPAKSGLALVIPGLVLTGSVVVAAFASVANKVIAFGFVNRIS